MSANPDFAPDSSLHWSEMAVDSASDKRPGLTTKN